MAKFGPVQLNDGISGWNAITFLFAAMMGIALLTSVNGLQGAILELNLALPEAEHGRISGTLNFWQEILIIILVGPVGALSDRYGRRPVFVGGMLVLALTLALYPLPRSFETLMAVRLLLAVGAALVSTAMMAVLADYPEDGDRGKFVSFMGIGQGTGILVLSALVLPKMPEMIEGMGATPTRAIECTFWFAASLALVSAAIMQAGLKPGTPSNVAAKKKTFELVKEGFAEAKRNLRIRLAYSAGYAARSAIVTVGLLMSLWAYRAGINAGLPTDEALAKSGTIIGLIQGPTLLWAPIFGIMIDRMDRVKALFIAMALAAVGYTAVAMVGDPLSPMMYWAGPLLGVGEISTVLAAQSLVGENAPKDTRGSVSGVYTFCGAVGILITSAFGGYLFDTVGMNAPFYMMGIVATIVAIGAIMVMSAEAKAKTAAAPAE